MRILRRISALICMLLVLTVGFVLIFTAILYMANIPVKDQVDMQINLFRDSLRTSGDTQIITLLTGLLLLLVGCVTIYLAITDIQSSGRIKLESPGGRLTISASAIEEHLSRKARTIDGVKELKPKIRRTPTGWALYARVSVWSDQNIKELNDIIREEVRRVIIGIVGEHSIEPIDIHITKITERGRVGSRRAADIEFTG